ncbi:SubName: Full=Uncharacterized protein {ECO:0000313/EMBL:CCA73670.1} [Serendipita indica DSM 11827]|uniref:Saccharopine dehydrogenase NADP binding domain-containing protein n=1 Tax=Serendipita indica (strain DSM 11827) TaxID=1109443 RepID=G4TQS9_SERID|nr:SubName: Full=Uncharacterized protein {ECO:0000313/EMBL:CCA73670.1} [Serendipita indica DSM 11827]CCA73670.1 hypothetical protein PIIN_07623 [Serendipita indica DSM 11827]
MSTQTVNVLILGATGYTGTLITEYLEQHPERTKFSLGIAGRSLEKLQKLKKDLSLSAGVKLFAFNLSDEHAINDTVRRANVIINCIGPFWRYSTPIVRACAVNGVHYVDITGEPWWIRDLLREYDFTAMKSKAIIIPASGMDSVPSDLAVYLSARALLKRGEGITLGKSVTAIRVPPGLSGGTLSTVLSAAELPKSKLIGLEDPFALTPAKGIVRPFKMVHSLPFTSIYGGQSLMESINEKIVNRTWGLLEADALSTELSASRHAPPFRYGPNFVYQEFSQTPSRFAGLMLSVMYFFGAAVVFLFPPVRWFLKRFGPQPGGGPKQVFTDKAKIVYTNVTSTDGPKPEHVKTRVEFRGGAYTTTAVLVSESALAILFNHAELPKLGQAGGILTPMAALGDTLVTRLLNSGRLTYDTHTLHPGESRKAV